MRLTFDADVEAFRAEFIAFPWRRGRAGTIAGGTSEIQRIIIAQRLLGLPRN